MSATVELKEPGVLLLKGRVTVSNVMAVRKIGDSIIDKMVLKGVIDLSELESANAITLSLLLAWLRTGVHKNNSLDIRHMPRNLFDMARVSGLELILPFEVRERAS